MEMRKNDDWRTRIFRDGEKRLVDLVITPALAELAESRRLLEEKMPEEGSGDDQIRALFEAELERMDHFAARLKQHLTETRGRFARLDRDG